MSASTPAAPGGPSALRRGARVTAQVALKLAYPLMFFAAWRYDMTRYLGVALLALLWLQRWVGAGSVAAMLRRLTALDWSVAAALSCACAAIALTGSELLLRLYPTLVNAGLLAAFAATLSGGPTMIEKFARLRHPELSARQVQHTRRMTKIWCAFFVANGAVSAYLAWCGARAAWALYNGVVAYLIIGALIGGEIVWRHVFVLPKKPAMAAGSEAL
ncbi:hypothetical protein AAHK20_09400 [Trinickia sp. YCB016]